MAGTLAASVQIWGVYGVSGLDGRPPGLGRGGAALAQAGHRTPYGLKRALIALTAPAMRVLFAHKYLPGQFQHLAATLAREPGNEVVFIHAEEGKAAPGVTARRAPPARPPAAATHHYLRPLEDAVLHGQAAYRAGKDLRREGFRPDVICAHAGFGPGLYLKDVFPRVPLLSYFEWFYRARGSDVDFLGAGEVSEDDALRIRTANAAILLELTQCDRGVCPTVFQRDQFPHELSPKLTVVHDGVDTDFFAPLPQRMRPTLPDLVLPEDAEIVTYATRGLEPYRGFPQAMEAIAILQAQRPRLHAVIAGADRVYYSRPAPAGTTYKQLMLDRLSDLDRSRLHFLKFLPLNRYRDLLQASSVHVYLTVPFVLSWSLIEAMATGCTIVASDTAPVREVIDDNDSGLLADLLSPADIAAKVALALDDPTLAARLAAGARRTAVSHYDLSALLPRRRRLLEEVAGTGD